MSTPISDQEAIAKAGDQIIAALNTDDLDGIMACATDDHITMAPDVPALDDLNALRKWQEDRIEAVSTDFAFTTHELEVIGDWAYQRWSTSAKITPKAGGDATQTELKGIWIWRRQADGSWKIARSIWNTDSPPQGEPST